MTVKTGKVPGKLPSEVEVSHTVTVTHRDLGACQLGCVGKGTNELGSTV